MNLSPLEKYSKNRDFNMLIIFLRLDVRPCLQRQRILISYIRLLLLRYKKTDQTSWVVLLERIPNEMYVHILNRNILHVRELFSLILLQGSRP